MQLKNFSQQHRIWKSFTVGMFLLLPIILLAQSPSQTTTITLKEVALEAPRLNTSRFLMPGSISAVNLVSLQGFQQQLSLQEYLRSVPGLFSLNANNYAQDLRLSIRGFGSRAAFGIRGVKIIVDGIPETTPDGQGQLDNLPLGLLSRLEVLRGPSASLYGNAAGGVLYLTTLDSLEGEVIKFRATLGSYTYQNYQLTTHVKGKATTALFHINRTTTDGFRTFSGLEQNVFNAKIKHSLNSRSSLNFQLNYTNSPKAEDAGGLTLEETTTYFRQARQRNVDYDTFEKIDQLKLGMHWKQQWGTQWSLDSYAFYSFRDFYGKLPFENGGIVDLFRNYYGVGTRLNYEEMQTGFTHRWQLGLERNDQRDQRDRFMNLRGSQGERTFSQLERFGNFGASLLDELQWEKILVRTALRFDYQTLGADSEIETQEYTVLNPSIGLSYALAENHRLFANFSTSFETPTLSELSANPSGEEGLNLNLNPSKAINFELGWKTQNSSGFFEATGFYIKSSNEILPYELEAFPGRSFYRNAGATDRYGLEVAAAYQWNPWKIEASLTQAQYQFVEETKEENLGGMALPGIPNSQAFLQLSYKSNSDWKWVLSGEHIGQFYANNSNSVAINSFQKLRFQTQKTVKLSWGNFDFFGGINNLLNETYYDNIRLNAFGGRFYEPAPGRNFYLGMQLGL
ncbi:TonB-dependent receptor [Flavobacteriaceae bacterium]|nr:TonB-dependent receptor [Flavobacteriaceae bacterium]MDA7797468.1 TonB-dependent receptor [Flavobacteriaceae bacterium]